MVKYLRNKKYENTFWLTRKSKFSVFNDFSVSYVTEHQALNFEPKTALGISFT